MIIVIDILKFVVLVLITFFSCQIITGGKKRISYIGTLLICFSTAVIEYINSGLIEAIIFSELLFYSISKLLSEKKYLYSIGVGIRNRRFFITLKY